jgi:hypothetical protein
MRRARRSWMFLDTILPEPAGLIRISANSAQKRTKIRRDFVVASAFAATRLADPSRPNDWRKAGILDTLRRALVLECRRQLTKDLDDGVGPLLPILDPTEKALTWGAPFVAAQAPCKSADSGSLWCRSVNHLPRFRSPQSRSQATVSSIPCAASRSAADSRYCSIATGPFFKPCLPASGLPALVYDQDGFGPRVVPSWARI